jgi:hypothetical protein
MHITVSVSWNTCTVQGTAHLDCASTSNMYCARNGTPGLYQHFKQVPRKEQRKWTVPVLQTGTVQGTAHLDCASTSKSIRRQSQIRIKPAYPQR